MHGLVMRSKRNIYVLRQPRLWVGRRRLTTNSRGRYKGYFVQIEIHPSIYYGRLPFIGRIKRVCLGKHRFRAVDSVVPAVRKGATHRCRDPTAHGRQRIQKRGKLGSWRTNAASRYVFVEKTFCKRTFVYTQKNTFCDSYTIIAHQPLGPSD